MFCPNCGSKQKAGAEFCSECGTNLKTDAKTTTVTDDQAKSKMAAGLFQIFLGSFGVGRFYLGYTGIAIAQIAVTWLTCGLGAIWPLIDGIMILSGSVTTDANGNPLKD